VLFVDENEFSTEPSLRGAVLRSDSGAIKRRGNPEKASPYVKNKVYKKYRLKQKFQKRKQRRIHLHQSIKKIIGRYPVSWYLTKM